MLDPVELEPTPDGPVATGLILLFVLDVLVIAGAIWIFWAKGWL